MKMSFTFFYNATALGLYITDIKDFLAISVLITALILNIVKIKNNSK